MLTVSVIPFTDSVVCPDYRESVRMVVLSIQICNGLKVLKKLGTTPSEWDCNHCGSIYSVHTATDGRLCSNFFFPIDMRQHPFDCYIATTSCGPFQTLFPSARVGKVCYLINTWSRPNAQYARMLAWLCSVVKSRVIYAQHKLRMQDELCLQRLLVDVLYSFGSDLTAEGSSPVHKDLLGHVFARAN